MFSAGLHAQKVVYLNAARAPISDTTKYVPCYYSVSTDYRDSIDTKTYTLDHRLVKANTDFLDERGEKVKNVEKTYGGNGALLTIYTESDNILGESYSEAQVFYESGILKSKVTCKGKDIIEGIYFDENGNEREKPVEVLPEPFKGMVGWNQYLEKSLTYPKIARRKGMEGIVYVIFEVSEEGKMENLEVTNPELHPPLAQEALRVLSEYPHLWSPASENGEKCRVLMRVPLRFKL